MFTRITATNYGRFSNITSVYFGTTATTARRGSFRFEKDKLPLWCKWFGKIAYSSVDTRQAKEQIRQKGLNQKGYFAQYITATPQPNLHNDHYQILDKPATEFDLENDDISGGASKEISQ